MPAVRNLWELDSPMGPSDRADLPISRWKRVESCDSVTDTVRSLKGLYGCSAYARNYRSAAGLDCRR
jgi:hypothetical protein